MQDLSETTSYLEHKDHLPTSADTTSTSSVALNTAAGLLSKFLFMTCHVLVDAPDGSSVQARLPH